MLLHVFLIAGVRPCRVVSHRPGGVLWTIDGLIKKLKIFTKILKSISKNKRIKKLLKNISFSKSEI